MSWLNPYSLFKAAIASGLITTLVVFSACVQAAETSRQPQAELDAITIAIEEIQSWLVTAHATYSTEEANLRDAELSITEANRSIADVQKQLVQTQSEQSLLETSITSLEADKAAQLVLLQQVIRTAYMRGDQNLLKLLLNQEDFGASARMLHYYRIYSESRVDALQQFQMTLDTIALQNTELQTIEQLLSRQQNTLEVQLGELENRKQARQLALHELQNSISTSNNELEQLQIDQQQLQQLIAEIQLAIERIPSSNLSTPFINQRGSLPPPVVGRIIQQFGARYGDGNLRRQGITFEAAEGSPVQAVHAGRVVFADWLRGSGLLLIVDHGDGYMSLYSNNEALAKTAGDRVGAGEIVATSGGDSVDSNGLYFEIRHHGTPEDPTDWLQH